MERRLHNTEINKSKHFQFYRMDEYTVHGVVITYLDPESGAEIFYPLVQYNPKKEKTPL
jgi:hypothetical protein